MNIELNVEDFVWKVEPTGDYIGELFLNSHPKFQKTFTPKDLVLMIDNKKTQKYGIFPWFSSQQVGLSMDHMYKCHTLVESNLIMIPSSNYDIIAILRHQ
jgi:hypothetical protein